MPPDGTSNAGPIADDVLDATTTLPGMEMNRRARVVLVGSGRMGQIRASLLYANPRFDLCGVVDVNFEAASALAGKFSTRAFPSLNAAFKFHRDLSGDDVPSLQQRRGIDGIVISSPTFTHDSIIREAAELEIDGGLHIFVEKPVDETSDKIQELFTVCHKAETVLCCGFQRRFDDSYAATKQAVTDGKVGKPLMSTVFFADHPSPPIEFLLKGGNIFMDLLPHDLDYVRWCLDDEVASVYAIGSSSTDVLRDAGVHDNATVVATFSKGAVVTFQLSRSATYGYDQRCEIFGSKGLVSVGNERATTSVLSDTSGIHSSKWKHSFPQRFHQGFSSELDRFADCILDGVAWPISAKDCIAVQTVTDAARRSCELNAVVHI